MTLVIYNPCPGSCPHAAFTYKRINSAPCMDGERVRIVRRGSHSSLVINGSGLLVRDDGRIVQSVRIVWGDLNARQTSHNNSALNEGC